MTNTNTKQLNSHQVVDTKVDGIKNISTSMTGNTCIAFRIATCSCGFVSENNIYREQSFEDTQMMRHIKDGNHS